MASHDGGSIAQNPKYSSRRGIVDFWLIEWWGASETSNTARAVAGGALAGKELSAGLLCSSLPLKWISHRGGCRRNLLYQRSSSGPTHGH
jgi:hypothetical protein